ncbi:FAD-binding FR-type domain-containing protein [Fusarium keratoplasticum]|uniref:FAD-binding FR-type domain-containing protein n=1 Tax=Fusarium keratoplasticum TaxID=1328300 RepID=A0ACC0QCK8_9HYPO|nr:FAD-binding FR-type domain-containing protein [Fusarium keratoplasticum]KAI8648240.1 FAD-binding FR-type domain-containing protein [Fusarium keratoplasticum]
MASAPRPPRSKQQKNEETLTVYALLLFGLFIFVVSAHRWHSSSKGAPQKQRSAVKKAQEATRRASVLAFHKPQLSSAWEWFGRPSLGLVTLVGVFLAANTFLCSTSFASHAVNHFASRYGWMASANMALCVFFGMKNTPLALVSSLSHASLNVLHRVVGYVAVLLIVLHAILYTIFLSRQGRLAKLLESSDLSGIGAGITMIVLLLTGLYRYRHYEMFYIGHIAGFVMTIILAVLHRPLWAKKLPIVMLFTAGLWAIDRTLRTSRLSWNVVNNHALCYPLPGGGIRLLLKKPSVEGATPGSHCYLWIPRVRFFQLHPFTIVSNGPLGLELVIKSQQGFTEALGEFAMKQPGRAIWASLDGPYGALPDTTGYDKLVFISGGSGAAFTFGLMNRILHRTGGLISQPIDFVWAVKHTEHLAWFGDSLRDLASADSTVNMFLHITKEEPGPMGSDGLVVFPEFANFGVKSENSEAQPLLTRTASKDSQPGLKASVVYERMNPQTVVQNAMFNMGSHEQILICVCGPKSLMDRVKETVNDCWADSNPRIDIHCEDFGGS